MHAPSRPSSLLFVLSLAACTRSMPLAPEEGGPGGPFACPGDITVSQGGYSTDDPPLADPNEAMIGMLPTPHQVHLGIFQEPARDVTMVWHTDTSTLYSQVEIQGAEGTWTVDGASFLTPGGEYRVHEVRVCGLEPETTYVYRVGGGFVWSEPVAFTTATEDPYATIRVGFCGDSRDGYNVWSIIAQEMAAREVDFIVFTGDMVNTGTELDQWDEWLEAAEGVIDHIPLVAVVGNHEAMAAAYFQLMSLPGNEEWYAVDWGPVRVSVLNDTPAEEAGIIDETVWLANSLEVSEKPWNIVSHHEPMWTASSHTSELERRDTWGIILDEFAPLLVLNGHNHLYERSVPIRYGVMDPYGNTYAVAGGSGAPLYAAGSDWYIAMAESVYSYGIAEIDAEQIHARAWRLDGSLLDEFVMTQ